MNTTNGSIHPVIKALVAGFSLMMMSALVWYSHIQAQSKPASSDGAPAEKSPATAIVPSGVAQTTTEQQHLILMSGSKSFTGTTTLNAGTLAPQKAPQPQTEEQRKVLMQSSKTTVITQFIEITQQPETLSGPAKSTDAKNKTGQAQPQASGAVAIPDQKAVEKSPKTEVPQGTLMLGSKSMGQPVFSTRKISPPKPDESKKILMFGSKAPAMPLISPEQKAAPPVEPQKVQQQKQAKTPAQQSAP